MCHTPSKIVTTSNNVQYILSVQADYADYAEYAEHAGYAEYAENAGYAEYEVQLTADGAYHCPVGSIWLFLQCKYLT